jgi:hypothetical protein
MTDVATILKGQQVQLWPYSRGLYPRDTLHTLWRLVESGGGADQVFHSQIGVESDPYPWRGDLTEFVKYFDDPGRRILLMAMQGEALMGLCWFDDIVPGYRAAYNLYFRKRAYGNIAHEATTLAFRYGFDVLGVQSIWGYTPWRAAVEHGKRHGMAVVATLPGFARVEGKPTDVSILRITKEEHDVS